MDKLLEQLASIDSQLDKLLAADEMTADQKAEHDRLLDDRKKVRAKIEQQKAADDRATERAAIEAEARSRAEAAESRARAEANRRIRDAAKPVATAEPKVHAEPRDPKVAATWGFRSFGEFAQEVMESRRAGSVSNRIISGWNLAQQSAATGMGEAVGSDGGFLVPQEFSNRIFERMYSPDSLLTRTDIYTVGGNSIVFPRNAESSRATGSRWGGVQSYWLGEGSSITASKPTFGRLTLNLHKLAALGVMTDELLADNASALDQYLTKCFSAEIAFRVSDSLVNGTGAGQPLGILNAACTVSVSKETGQSAATINATNILKMWARMFAPCRQNSVWLINQDVEPQLYSMQIGTGVANQVVYMPPGGLSQAPYATLMGRPVLPVEYCATLGTVGDIILVDLSQWVTAVKSGGPQSAVSMHLYFNTDEQAFRVTYRVDSQPWWAAALTPYKGSATQSCAVTLATRS